MNDVDARPILLQAWPLVFPARAYNLSTIQCVQAVARLESHEGVWPGAGAGSNNWGAITGAGNAGSFQAGDSRPGKGGVVHYVTNFARYATPLDGAKGLLAWLAHHPECLDAADRGIEPDFSRALYHAHYYTGTSPDPETNIKLHADAVYNSALLIANELGEQLMIEYGAQNIPLIGQADNPEGPPDDAA